MAEVFVAKSVDLPEGSRRLVVEDRHHIGVIRANGRLHAFANLCPHQGGPVCDGLLIHRVEEVIAPDKTYHGMRFNRDDLHLVCPWHGWEFDIESGRCAGDGRHRLRRYETVERDDAIFVVV